MTSFILACSGLVLLSGLFYLFPRGNPASGSDDTSRANLEWYRLRRDELLREGREELQHDAELRLLEDDAQAGAGVVVSEHGQSFPRWLLLPVVAVAAERSPTSSIDSPTIPTSPTNGAPPLPS